jgi:hypothetical protein
MARARGHCLKCNAELAGTAITRHLQKCVGPGDARLVTVTDRHGGPWWLCLAVEPTADLRAIDKVLRDIGIPCCHA